MTNGESNTSNNQQTRINKGAFILTKRIGKKKKEEKRIKIGTNKGRVHSSQ